MPAEPRQRGSKITAASFSAWASMTARLGSNPLGSAEVG